MRLITKLARCSVPACPLGGHLVHPSAELQLALPRLGIGWDVFCWIGHRRFSEDWRIGQIRAELHEDYSVDLSLDSLERYAARYASMVAAREQDLARLEAVYRDSLGLVLTIDGLQPEKGHETLYVVRELTCARVLFAEPLLSSAAAEISRLLVRAQRLVKHLRKPVLAWMSDKQEAFVSGIQEVFPGVPHRYCANHFLRDAAKPVLERDSQAKVLMRQKVRGLRAIERDVLAEHGPAGDGAQSPASAVSSGPTTVFQVVLDYCAAVRGVLADDQGGPLRPPGLRMADALGDISDSLHRLILVRAPEYDRCLLERLKHCIDVGVSDRRRSPCGPRPHQRPPRGRRGAPSRWQEIARRTPAPVRFSCRAPASQRRPRPMSHRQDDGELLSWAIRRS